MTLPTIGNRELEALIKASSLGGILADLDRKRQDTEAPSRSTIAARKEAMAEALATVDDEKLIEWQEVLSNYVDGLASADVEFNGHGAELTPTQKVYLMRRYLDTKLILELAETVKAGLKRIVGEAVTAQVAAADPNEPFPEHVSGSIAVPELGKRFCKEGAGRKPVKIDMEKLRANLGEQLWSEVTETVEIPAVEARTETVLSELQLVAKAMQDPDVMAKLEASFVTEEQPWKAWSMTVRDIK